MSTYEMGKTIKKWAATPDPAATVAAIYSDVYSYDPVIICDFLQIKIKYAKLPEGFYSVSDTNLQATEYTITVADSIKGNDNKVRLTLARQLGRILYGNTSQEPISIETYEHVADSFARELLARYVDNGGTL